MATNKIDANGFPTRIIRIYRLTFLEKHSCVLVESIVNGSTCGHVFTTRVIDEGRMPDDVREEARAFLCECLANDDTKGAFPW